MNLTWTGHPPWPGITEPHCHLCTWAFLNGTFQVKFINRMCVKHGRLLSKGE